MSGEEESLTDRLKEEIDELREEVGRLKERVTSLEEGEEEK